MKVVISRNLYIILLIDILLLSLSLYLAHLVRFDFQIPDHFLEKIQLIIPWGVGLKLVCFYYFDLYRGMWRYTGLNDLFNVAKAVTIANLLNVVLILYVNRFEGVSRSVFVIDWCLSIFFIGASRIATRLVFEQFTEVIHIKDLINVAVSVFQTRPSDCRRILIIGAGDCGEKICKEIKEDPTLKYYVEGFLDDDSAKIGRKIHGARVLGQIDSIGKIAEATGAQELIIAIPTLKSKRMRQIVEQCKTADIDFKIMPGMGELINGKVTINYIRDVAYRDLLGRKPVELDQESIGRYIGKKIVLVSGAGGSIGKGLCHQICRYSPEKMILFERAESPLYELDLELRKAFPKVKVIPVLGDVQNREELFSVFERIMPDIIFHAAAYKHVPMLEKYPWKSVENNVIGTENLVEMADRFECDKFVFISTDKAVNPTNVMGACKRIGEMVVQNRNTVNQSKTNFVTVRFGNVIGSAGSVIPLFKKQIMEGGPVTVTHPDMIRYFMLIPEACQLILQAGAMGKGGEIFVLEMGEPVNIANMAKDLIRFSGFEPDVDIKIEYIGLRPGEKLYEELMTDDENVVPTDHKKIHVFGCCQVDMHELNGKLERLKLSAQKRDKNSIIHILKEIVPEYSPDHSTGNELKN